MTQTQANQRRFARLRLHVRQLDALADFYQNALGMHQFEASHEGLVMGYDREHCLLELHGGASRPLATQATDLYWKMGVTVRNLDAAHAHVRNLGVAISDPRQFRDIGYMCHLQDPEGFSIELLQQGFAGDAKLAPAGHPLGAQATLAHITLRVTNLEAARRYCEEVLALRLVSVQPVDTFGFCLYFYSWCHEEAPNEELKAVENRPWLWARPYALLELQHLENAARPIVLPTPDAAGFAGFGYRSSNDSTIRYVLVSDLEAIA